METNKRSESPREKIALYALGVLSEAESRQLTTWLATDGREHQDELAAAEEVASLLGYIAPPVTPAPNLKARLFDHLQSE